MSVELAEVIWLTIAIYLALGVPVGLVYILGGAGKIDPAAKGKGLPFKVRLMILPGLILLWPLMLLKLLTQSEPPLT